MMMTPQKIKLCVGASAGGHMNQLLSIAGTISSVASSAGFLRNHNATIVQDA